MPHDHSRQEASSRRSAREPVRIESIADHLDLIDTIAAWHWHEWGRTDRGGSQDAWAERIRCFTHRDRIPTMYVAFLQGELAGSVTLNAHDMATHLELSPWLSGVFVNPPARGNGVASSLVRHAMSEAWKLGVARLYLYTSSARGLYESLGWRALTHDQYDDHRVVIMWTHLPGNA